MRYFRIALFLLASACAAQQNDDRIGLRERFWVASKTYATVLQYFGHWQAVPDLNIDTVYRQYLDKIANSNDRLAFDLATMEFVAQFRNGHTGFDDKWLRNSQGPQPGF